MEVNGHPCDGGPMEGLLIKGQRMFKTMWKKSLEVTGVKSYYKFTDFFQEIAWKIKQRASGKYHGKQI